MSAGGFKKGSTTPMTEDVNRFLNQLSKAALLDCLVDAIGLIEGSASDALTVKEARDFCEPRLLVRGDKVPK